MVVKHDSKLNRPYFEFMHRTKEEQMKKNQAALKRLKELDEMSDEKEQTETWEYLKRVLDEDRLSERKLFPE